MESVEHPPRPQQKDANVVAPSTPLETFVAEHLATADAGYVRYKQPLNHRQLLKRAAQHLNLSPKKLGAGTALRSSGQVVGGFIGNITTLVSHQAQEISRSRTLVRRYLRNGPPQHTSCVTFNVADRTQALRHFRSVNTSVNLHAAAQAVKGASVFDIRNEGHFLAAWDTVVHASRNAAADLQEIEISQSRPWIPLRLFVIGEEVVAAVARIPLFVIGDGQSTVGELFEAEQHRRASYTSLAKAGPTVDDDFLALRDLSGAVIPAVGQIVFLSSNPSTRNGWALPVDVFQQVSEDLRTLAVSALWSIPGLSATAVDLYVPSLETSVGEIDSIHPDADLRDFRYPAVGRRRHVHLALMRKIADNASQLRSMSSGYPLTSVQL